MFLEDKKYKERTVEIKIKGNKSFNDSNTIEFIGFFNVDDVQEQADLNE